MIRKPLDKEKAASMPDVVMRLAVDELRQLAPYFGFAEEELLAKVRIQPNGTVEFDDDLDHDIPGLVDKVLRSRGF